MSKNDYNKFSILLHPQKSNQKSERTKPCCMPCVYQKEEFPHYPLVLNAKRNIIITVHMPHPIHVHEAAVRRVKSRHGRERAIVKGKRLPSRI